MKNRKTLNGYVLIKELTSKETKTASGIILPPQQKNRQRMLMGVVVLSEKKSPVKKGETVFFRNPDAYEILLEDEPLLIVEGRNLALVNSKP